MTFEIFLLRCNENRIKINQIIEIIGKKKVIEFKYFLNT